MKILLPISLTRNVSFLDEAIQGINFFSAQVDLFPYHEWQKVAEAFNEFSPKLKILISVTIETM